MSLETPPARVGREPATVQVAMWSARHRWPVVGLWFVVTIRFLDWIPRVTIEGDPDEPVEPRPSSELGASA